MLAARFGPTPAPGAIRPGPTQCHDITVYPAIGLAGGACGGYGLLLDISDLANPIRIGAVADSNFSYWHSATFNNDGTKLLFSDEWGGGGQPKCRATDKKEWGADAIFTLVERQMTLPELLQDAGGADRQRELRGPQRLADPDPGPRRHGPGLVPGRHLGLRLDRRGPPEGNRLLRPRPGGLHRDGRRRLLVDLLVQRLMYSSEIARGLDVFELPPSAFISQNEIDAAKLVHLDYLNAQGQPRIVWPASFAVLAQAYLDQLARSNGLAGRLGVEHPEGDRIGRQEVGCGAADRPDPARHPAGWHGCRRRRPGQGEDAVGHRTADGDGAALSGSGLVQ